MSVVRRWLLWQTTAQDSRLKLWMSTENELMLGTTLIPLHYLSTNQACKKYSIAYEVETLISPLMFQLESNVLTWFSCQ